jgi:hypothetical protein
VDADLYQFHYLSQNGYDSVIFIDLIVLSDTSKTLNLDIDTSTFYTNILIGNDATIFLNLTAKNVCDSLVTINFSVLTNTTNFLNKTANFYIYSNPVLDGFCSKSG